MSDTEAKYAAALARLEQAQEALREYDTTRARLLADIQSAREALDEIGTTIPDDHRRWLDAHSFVPHDSQAFYLGRYAAEDAPATPYVELMIERDESWPPTYSCVLSWYAEDDNLRYGENYASPDHICAKGASPEAAIREVSRVRELIHQRIDAIFDMGMALLNNKNGAD